MEKYIWNAPKDPKEPRDEVSVESTSLVGWLCVVGTTRQVRCMSHLVMYATRWSAASEKSRDTEESNNYEAHFQLLPSFQRSDRVTPLMFVFSTLNVNSVESRLISSHSSTEEIRSARSKSPHHSENFDPNTAQIVDRWEVFRPFLYLQLQVLHLSTRSGDCTSPKAHGHQLKT